MGTLSLTFLEMEVLQPVNSSACVFSCSNPTQALSLGTLPEARRHAPFEQLTPETVLPFAFPRASSVFFYVYCCCCVLFHVLLRVGRTEGWVVPTPSPGPGAYHPSMAAVVSVSLYLNSEHS